MFISGIVIHELGHLIAGLITGYHFYFIGLFGVYIIKDDKHWRFLYRRKTPIGQCMMYHENINKCPLPLIAGGITANIFMAVLGMLLSLMIRGFVLKLLFTASCMANLSLVFLNVFGSETCDGRTLKEVISYKSGRLYNEIMLIYHYIGDNADYGNIPWWLKEQVKSDLNRLGENRGDKSSLAEELKMHLKICMEQEKNGFLRKNS